MPIPHKAYLCKQSNGTIVHCFYNGNFVEMWGDVLIKDVVEIAPVPILWYGLNTEELEQVIKVRTYIEHLRSHNEALTAKNEKLKKKYEACCLRLNKLELKNGFKDEGIYLRKMFK